MINRFSSYWLPVIVWAVLIFVVSSISAFPEEIQPLFSFDKLAHTLEYAVFGFLLARAFKNAKTEKLKKYFRILAVVCGIVYGISDELHQSFVPLRTPSIIDLGCDFIGVVLGQMFFKKARDIQLRGEKRIWL